MPSVKISRKGCKTAATGVAVLMVVVLQVIGLEVVWPQQSAPPQTDQEIAKQEKIYRSRGGSSQRLRHQPSALGLRGNSC
jgi:hypothetical protein